MQTSVKSLAIETDVHRDLLHSKMAHIRLRLLPSASSSIHYSLELDAILSELPTALVEISAIKSFLCSVRSH
jgi:hypothetical protein